MKLYRLSQSFNTDWYTYDNAIVVANSKMEAKKIIPSPFYFYDDVFYYQYKNQEPKVEKVDPSWCNPQYVNAAIVGNTNLPSGTVVSSSFNAGFDESRYLDMRRLGKVIAGGTLSEANMKRAIDTLKTVELQLHDRGLAELRYHLIEANRQHNIEKTQEYELKIRDYMNEEYEDWT